MLPNLVAVRDLVNNTRSLNAKPLKDLRFQEYSSRLPISRKNAIAVVLAAVNRSGWNVKSETDELVEIRRPLAEGVNLPGWDVRLEIYIEAIDDATTRVSVDLGRTELGVKPLFSGGLRDPMNRLYQLIQDEHKRFDAQQAHTVAETTPPPDKELKDLIGLRDSGVLTDEEFEVAQVRLSKRLQGAAALSKCPDCQGTLSKMANTCPHCGRPAHPITANSRQAAPSLRSNLNSGVSDDIGKGLSLTNMGIGGFIAGLALSFSFYGVIQFIAIGVTVLSAGICIVGVALGK